MPTRWTCRAATCASCAWSIGIRRGFASNIASGTPGASFDSERDAILAGLREGMVWVGLKLTKTIGV